MFLIQKIKNPMIREVVDWTYHILIAIVIALIITQFIFQRTVVNKTSMKPTLANGDNLLVQKITTRFNIYKRGQIVTIYTPERVHEEGSTIIKRIVGLEGEHIVIKNGKVFINDKELNENYVGGHQIKALGEFCDMIIPQNNVYVLGDNRVDSILDSRIMGAIPYDRITGQAFVRIYPFDSFKFF